jgi:hypothetical protein
MPAVKSCTSVAQIQPKRLAISPITPGGNQRIGYIPNTASTGKTLTGNLRPFRIQETERSTYIKHYACHVYYCATYINQVGNLHNPQQCASHACCVVLSHESNMTPHSGIQRTTPSLVIIPTWKINGNLRGAFQALDFRYPP